MNGRFADEGDMPPGRPSTLFDDDPFALDDALVEQLLDAAEDDAVPATYQPLVHVLAAARGPATEAELAGELEAVALYRSSVATDGTAPRLGPVRRRRRHLKAVAAAGAISVVVATTGIAAATGSLPDGIQRMAAEVLSKIGITVPDGSPHRPQHPTDPSPASVETSITTEEAVPNDVAVDEVTAGDAAGAGPSVVDAGPSVSTATTDSVDPGGDPESPLGTPGGDPDNPLATPGGDSDNLSATPGGDPDNPLATLAETPVTAGPQPFEPAIASAESPFTADSPPVEPADPPPSSLPGSPPDHPSGPPLDNESGPPTDNQPGPPPESQARRPTNDSNGPPTNNQPGPPPESESGRPTNDSHGPPMNKQSGPPTDTSPGASSAANQPTGPPGA